MPKMRERKTGCGEHTTTSNMPGLPARMALGNLTDFARFFVAANVQNIANADEQVISWAMDRTMDLLFELFTPTNCNDIVETIYGPQMSEGVKDIFSAQVEDVMAALRAHAAAKLREHREGIIATVIHRRDLIM